MRRNVNFDTVRKQRTKSVTPTPEHRNRKTIPEVNSRDRTRPRVPYNGLILPTSWWVKQKIRKHIWKKIAIRYIVSIHKKSFLYLLNCLKNILSKRVMVGPGRAEPAYHGFRFKNFFCPLRHTKKSFISKILRSLESLMWQLKKAFDCKLAMKYIKFSEAWDVPSYIFTLARRFNNAKQNNSERVSNAGEHAHTSTQNISTRVFE